jgi:hypothetical protein
MYNKDGKFVKESKLGGNAWDISYHKQSGRIVVALQDSGVQFVDNFIAQTKISIQSITDCRGVTWVEDHVYVCGSDSNDDGLKQSVSGSLIPCSFFMIISLFCPSGDRRIMLLDPLPTT